MAERREFRLGQWQVLPDRRLMIRADDEVRVRPRAMDVLALLASRPGEVVTRDDFAQEVWAPAVVTDNSLNRCIAELRRALDDTSSDPGYIETIPRRGYRLMREPEYPEAAASDDARTLLPDVPSVRSIAMLPLRVLGEGDVELLAEGLLHEVLTSLALLGELQVISATSVYRYRDTVRTAGQIAVELGVHWLLQGAIQKADSRIRVNLQLVDARRDRNSWARVYEQPIDMDHLFGIQAEIAGDVAASLQARIGPEARKSIESVPTRSREAYEAYVQGRTLWNSRADHGLRRAEELFRRAVAIDPEFAEAWCGLADALGMLYDYGYESNRAVVTKAESALNRALELKPDLVDALASRGALLSGIRQYQASIQALRRAIERSPGLPLAHNWLSWTSALIGDACQAEASGIRAAELDPFSIEGQSNRALGHLARGDFTAARRVAAHTLVLQPDFNTAALYQAIAAWNLDEFEEVISLLEGQSVNWAGAGAEAVLALARLRLGQHDVAERLAVTIAESGYRFEAGLVRMAMDQPQETRRLWSALDDLDYFPLMSLHYGWFEDIFDRGQGTVDVDRLWVLARRVVAG